jgi:hypothetical protein
LYQNLQYTTNFFQTIKKVNKTPFNCLIFSSKLKTQSRTRTRKKQKPNQQNRKRGEKRGRKPLPCDGRDGGGAAARAMKMERNEVTGCRCVFSLLLFCYVFNFYYFIITFKS